MIATRAGLSQSHQMLRLIQTRYALTVFLRRLLPTHHDQPEDAPKNIFDEDDWSDDDINADNDELQQYLREPTEKPDDLIAWWLAKASIWPSLARMALDFLAIPATSTDVERVFSRGHLLLPYVRNRLSAKSTRALLCLGHWSKAGFVKDDVVLAITREKPEDLEAQDFEDADGYEALMYGEEDISH
jgi:hypothetical protein